MTESNEKFIKFCEENKIDHAMMISGTADTGFVVSTSDFSLDDLFFASLQAIFENTRKTAHETGEILAENLPAYVRELAKQYGKAKGEKDVEKD